jgi:hypothetical protein
MKPVQCRSRLGQDISGLAHSVAGVTALYTNFFFYQPYYGNDPRSFIQGHDQLDDKLWSEEIRLASKIGGRFV